MPEARPLADETDEASHGYAHFVVPSYDQLLVAPPPFEAFQDVAWMTLG